MTCLEPSETFLRAERDRIADELARLDQAIKIVAFRSAPKRRGPSVRTRVLDVLEELDRVWPAAEMLAALDRRGVPVTGSAPLKQVKTSMVQLVKDRLAQRVAPCTVRTTKFSTPSAGMERAM